LDKIVGVHAGRWHPEYARPIWNRDDGAIPMPSETTHTNVNARAFASDREA
jgi:hypothetical protein